ncbi:MAG: M15 family metallopeptidase [Actinomycetota bacterium]
MNVRLLAAGLVGAACGAVAVLALSGPSTTASGEVGAATTAEPEPTTTPAPTTAPDPRLDEDEDDVLLVWASSGLPDRAAARLASVPDILEVTTVAGHELELLAPVRAAIATDGRLGDGWVVPIDVLAIDPRSYSSVVPDGAAADLATLAPGSAALGETSAMLRGVGIGDVIELTSGLVEVAMIVPDRAVAGAELVVHHDDAERLGVVVDRFLLVAHDGDRREVQRAIDRALGLAAPVRFRTPAETTWLRHGDAVLPLAMVKDRFGEFAYRPGQGISITIDPAWEAAHLVEAAVPILGDVRCHRDLVPILDAALSALERDGLAHLVTLEQFAGCHVARRIGPDQALSRHSWGIAVDLNVDDNPRGSFSTQDPRLVETMREHGFGWGGAWLVPDPAHYELVAATPTASGPEPREPSG